MESRTESNNSGADGRQRFEFSPLTVVSEKLADFRAALCQKLQN